MRIFTVIWRNLMRFSKFIYSFLSIPIYILFRLTAAKIMFFQQFHKFSRLKC